MGIFESQEEQQSFLDALKVSEEAERRNILDRERVEAREDATAKEQAYNDYADEKAMARRMGEELKESWVPWEVQSAYTGLMRTGPLRAASSIRGLGHITGLNLMTDEMGQGLVDAGAEYDAAHKSGMEQAGVGSLRKGFNGLVKEAGSMIGQQIAGGFGLIPGVGPAIQGYNRYAGWALATYSEAELSLRETNPEMSDDERKKHAALLGGIEQGFMSGTSLLGKTKWLRGAGGAEDLWTHLPVTAARIEKLARPAKMFKDRFSRFTREKGRKFITGMTGETLEEVGTELATNFYRAGYIPGMEDAASLTNFDYEKGDPRRFTESKLFKTAWDVTKQTLGTMGLIQSPGFAKSAMTDFMERPSRGRYKPVRNILKQLGIEEDDTRAGRERARYLYDKLRESGLTQERINEIGAANGVSLTIDPDLPYSEEGEIPQPVHELGAYEVQPGVYLNPEASDLEASTVESIERQLMQYNEKLHGADGTRLRFYDSDKYIKNLPRGMTTVDKNGRATIWVSRKHVQLYASGQLGAFELRDLMHGTYMHELHDSVYKSGKSSELIAAIKAHAPEEFLEAKDEYEYLRPGLTEDNYEQEAVSMVIQNRIGRGDSGWLREIAGEDLGLFSKIRQWVNKRKNPLGEDTFHDLLFRMVRKVAETENIEPVHVPPQPGSGAALLSAIVGGVVAKREGEQARQRVQTPEPGRKAGRRARRILDSYKDETIAESNERLSEQAGREVYYYDTDSNTIKTGVLEDLLLDSESARIYGERVPKNQIFSAVKRVSSSTVSDSRASVGAMTVQEKDIVGEHLEVAEESGDEGIAVALTDASNNEREEADREEENTEGSQDEGSVDQPSHTGEDGGQPNPEAVDAAVLVVTEEVEAGESPEPLDRSRGRAVSRFVRAVGGGRVGPVKETPDGENDPDVGVVEDFDEVMTSPSDSALQLSDALLKDRQGIVTMSQSDRQEYADRFMNAVPGIQIRPTLMELALAQFLDQRGILTLEDFENSKRVLESRTISRTYRNLLDELNDLQLDYEILVRVTDRGRQEAGLKGDRKVKTQVLVEEAAKRSVESPSGRRTFQNADNLLEISTGVLRLDETDLEHEANLLQRMYTAEEKLRKKGYGEDQGLQNADLATMEFLVDRRIAAEHVTISKDGTLRIAPESKYVVDKRAKERAQEVARQLTDQAREVMRIVEDILAGISVGQENVPNQAELDKAREVVEDETEPYAKLTPEQKEVVDGIMEGVLDNMDEVVGGASVRQWYNTMGGKGFLWLKKHISFEDFPSTIILDAISDAIRADITARPEIIGNQIRFKIADAARKQSDLNRRQQIDAGTTQAERRQRAADLRRTRVTADEVTEDDLTGQEAKNRQQAELETALGGGGARQLRPGDKRPPKKSLRVTKKVRSAILSIKNADGEPEYSLRDLGITRRDSGNEYFEAEGEEVQWDKIQAILEAAAKNERFTDLRSAAQNIRDQHEEPDAGWESPEEVMPREEVRDTSEGEQLEARIGLVREGVEGDLIVHPKTIEDIAVIKDRGFYRLRDDTTGEIIYFPNIDRVLNQERGSVTISGDNALINVDPGTGDWTLQRHTKIDWPYNVNDLELVPESDLPPLEKFRGTSTAEDQTQEELTALVHASNNARKGGEPTHDATPEVRESLVRARIQATKDRIKKLAPGVPIATLREDLTSPKITDVDEVARLLEELDLREGQLSDIGRTEHQSPGDAAEPARDREKIRVFVRKIMGEPPTAAESASGKDLLDELSREETQSPGDSDRDRPRLRRLFSGTAKHSEFLPLSRRKQGVSLGAGLKHEQRSKTGLSLDPKLEAGLPVDFGGFEENVLVAEVSQALNEVLGRDGLGLASTTEKRLVALSSQITMVQEGPELRKMREEKPRELAKIVDWLWEVEDIPFVPSRGDARKWKGGAADFMPREVATIKLGLVTGKWPPFWQRVVDERRKRFTARVHLSPGDGPLRLLEDSYNVASKDEYRAPADAGYGPHPPVGSVERRVVIVRKRPMVEDDPAVGRELDLGDIDNVDFNTLLGADLRDVAYKVLKRLSKSVYRIAAQEKNVPAGQEEAYSRRAEGESYSDMAERAFYNGGEPVPIAEAHDLVNKEGSDWTFAEYGTYHGLLKQLEAGVRPRAEEILNKEILRLSDDKAHLAPKDATETEAKIDEIEKGLLEEVRKDLDRVEEKWKDGVVLYSKSSLNEDVKSVVDDLSSILEGKDSRDIGWDASINASIREVLASMTRPIVGRAPRDPVTGRPTGGAEVESGMLWDEFDPENFSVESWLQFNGILTTFLVDSMGNSKLTDNLTLQKAIRKTFRVYSLLREADTPQDKVKIIKENVGREQRRPRKISHPELFLPLSRRITGEETRLGEEIVITSTKASRNLEELFKNEDHEPGYRMLQLLFAQGQDLAAMSALEKATKGWGGKIPEDLSLEDVFGLFKQSSPLLRGNELARRMEPAGGKEGGELWAGIFSLLYGNASLLGDPTNNFSQLSFMRQMAMLGDLNPMGLTHEGPTQLTELKQRELKGQQKDIEERGIAGMLHRLGFESAAVATWEFLNQETLDRDAALQVEAIFGDRGYKEALYKKAAEIMAGTGRHKINPAEVEALLRGREELIYFRLGADTGRGLVALRLDNMMGNFEAVSKEFAEKGKHDVHEFQRHLEKVDKATGKSGIETPARVEESINEGIYYHLSPGDVGGGRPRKGRRTTPTAFSREAQNRYNALRAQARSRKERDELDSRKHTDQRVNEEADKKVERLGWKGVINEAVDIARRGTRGRFNDVDQVALTKVINSLTSGQKKKNIKEISLAMTAAMSITTSLARGLRAAGTVLSEEDQRLRSMHKAVFTPEKALHQKLESLRAEGDTVGAERLHEEWISGEGRYAGKGLPALHRYLESMGVDPLALDKMKDDPYYANKVLNLAGQHKADLMDGASEWFRNSILGAITTQAANIVGTAPYFMWEVGVKRNLEALVNLAVQDPQLPTFAENAVIFKHMMKNMGSGARMGLMAFKEEAPIVESLLGYEGRRGGSTKIEGLRTAIKGKKGKVIRIPQNVLLGMDEWMKWTMSHGFAAGYAFRTARAAVKNGVIKPGDSAMFMDKLLNDKDKLVYTPAMNESLQMLWQTPLGKAGQQLIQMREAWRPLRFVMPFVVTPINIFKTGVRMSPLGAGPAIVKAARLRAEGKSIAETWRKLSPDVIEQGISWMLMFALMGGDDEDPESQWITGSSQEWKAGPRQASRREGMPPPFSVKIGNTWASYERIEPFATVVGTLVDMAEALKAGDIETLTGNTWKSLYGQMYNKTFTRSFADMVDAAHNWKERGFYSGAGHWATNFGAAWIPNYIRSTGRALNPKVPERGLWGDDAEIKARTLDRLRGKLEVGLVDNTPKVDLWGREIDRTNIHNPASSFMYQLAVPVRLKNTDLFVGDRVLLKWNAKHAETDKAKYPRAPKKNMEFRGEKRHFSDSQYNEYAKLSGQIARQLVATSNLNVDNPTETDLSLILNGVERARTMARKILGPKFFGEGLVRSDYTITEVAEEIRDKQIKSWASKLSEKPPTWKILDDEQKKLPKERKADILERLRNELEEQKQFAYSRLDQLGIDVPTALRKYGKGDTGRRRIAAAMNRRA